MKVVSALKFCYRLNTFFSKHLQTHLKIGVILKDFLHFVQIFSLFPGQDMDLLPVEKWASILMNIKRKLCLNVASYLTSASKNGDHYFKALFSKYYKQGDPKILSNHKFRKWGCVSFLEKTRTFFVQPRRPQGLLIDALYLLLDEM